MSRLRASLRVLLSTCIALGLTAAVADGQICQPQWLPGQGSSGVGGSSYALTAWDPDGPGPRSAELVVGGSFTTAGNILVSNIACWGATASVWSTLGSGMDGYVTAMAVFDGRLYVGGGFTTAGGVSANHIACLDPLTSTWSALGSGTDDYVSALTVMDGKLYVGGNFTTAGGISANRIACWDPATSTWSALGSGTDNTVRALSVLGGKLYVGGWFTSAGGATANHIACWDPTACNWSTLGAGVNGNVVDLAVLDDRLYVGGGFTTAGEVSVEYIACWDPAALMWSSIGSGLNRGVSRLTALDGKLYAGGTANTTDGPRHNRVACWDPVTATWSVVAAGEFPGDFPYSIYVMSGLAGKLYVGGYLKTLGGVGVDGIGCWNPATSTWSTLGAGVNHWIDALTSANGKVYAGGAFTSAGAVAANRIACYDTATQTWSALGSGIDKYVRDVAVLGGKVYAGGEFVTAGGVVAPRIACWDPATSTWSALGSGIAGSSGPIDSVNALAVLNGKLYAGGGFTSAGGVSVSNIASWDPVSAAWSGVGGGIGSTGLPGSSYASVSALAVLGGKLYVGGQFARAGQVYARNVACWDPATSAWSELGYGPNLRVSALVALDGKLYAGGEFTWAGGMAANRIACWDPATSTWSALGPGIETTDPDDGVWDLAVLNGKLYVGGDFDTVGGVAANGLACWDPATSTWSAVGSGVAGEPYAEVFALAASNETLYVGGYFTMAGGQVSAYWARWHEPAPVISLQPASITLQPGVSAEFSVNASGSGLLSYQWRKNRVPLADGGNVFGSTTPTLTVSPVHMDDDGDGYDVIVTDDCRSVPSDMATLTVVCPPADFDCDGDVDQIDFGRFQTCLTDTGVPQDAPECAKALLDGDRFVDQADFRVFQGCLSGAGAPADLDCGS